MSKKKVEKGVLIKALKAAFPHTIPIMTGFLFLGMTYGIYMNVLGFSFWYPMLTRFLPFLVFGRGKETPKYVQYLGKALPAAVFGLLVVYCLKDVNILAGNHGIPEAIAILVVVLLHLWKKQMLLSIAGGTVCYMLLVQLWF